MKLDVAGPAVATARSREMRVGVGRHSAKDEDILGADLGGHPLDCFAAVTLTDLHR